jgi:hypothetical protein
MDAFVSIAGSQIDVGYCSTPTPRQPERWFAVYRGDALTNLTRVAAYSFVSFYTEAGEKYVIACDGVEGTMLEAPFRLTLHSPPANDAFSARAVVHGSDVAVPGTCFAATREPGEPFHQNPNAPSTAWWSWTAPFTGLVRAAAHPPGYPTSNMADLAVYVGDALERLLPVPWDDTSGVFYARRGVTYCIAAVGWGYYAPEPFILSLSPASSPPNLVHSESHREPDGTFVAGVSGTAGQAFVVQTSTNLIDWEILFTDTFQTNLSHMADPESRSSLQRYYRALALESVLPEQPLQIEPAGFSAEGGFQLRVTGPAAEPYRIQTSTNLLTWDTFVEGVLFGENGGWIDGGAAAVPSRYYRVVPWR